MKDWKQVSLGDIFDIARGGSPRPIESFITDDPSGVNWIMIGDASANSKYISNSRKRIIKEGVAKSRMVKPGDFLLTNSMSFGHPYILKISGCIHDGWLVLSPKDRNVDPDFFYHLLGSKTVYAEFSRRASGTTVKNLSIDLVNGVRILFPPLSEQRRIATILDKAAAIRRKRRRAIELMNDLLRAVFLEMFGEKARGRQEWREVKLAELLSFLTSGSRGWAKYYAPRGEAFLRIQNVGNNRLILDDVAFVEVPSGAEAERTRVQAGDILLSITADLGRTAVIPDRIGAAYINQHLAILRIKGAEPLYVSAFLASEEGQRQIRRLNRVGVKSGLNFDDIRSLKILLPPTDLQRRFIDIYRKVSTMEATLADSGNKVDQLFLSLTHQLFSEKQEKFRADRATINSFMNFVTDQVGMRFPKVYYPEDDPSTPSDARIDAIYCSKAKEIHIEHTSVDLIVSGKRNKRSLDPAFILIEEALSKSSIPSHLGIYIHFPMEAARDVKRVKASLSELIEKVTQYIEQTDSSEWDNYPRKPDSICANGIVFVIQPDVLKRGKVLLDWSASDENYLEPDQLEKAIEEQIASKLEKLSNSMKRGLPSSIGLLLVETNDVAARGFHHFAGEFARIIDRRKAKCTEVWGIHGNSTPTLIWCEPFDTGITRSVYSEDPANRTFYEIETQRMMEWTKLRKTWACHSGLSCSDSF